jgi:F420-dependent oxidoreductase-like protein
VTRLGYQIPNFTYAGVGPADLFDVVAKQATAADRSGFDTVLLMDHFYQLPMLGSPDAYMLECYTALGGLARETSRVRLGALVTGNTYRNPALLAKIITTLDVVSGGRAQLGIGAGWFEFEHESLGFEFGTFTDRFEKLEEALQIILPMLRDERPTLAGARYSVKDAINQPPPVGRVPVMIGGSGETKTLRLVAQYADESNLTSPADEIPRKLDALAGHCARLGRDRSEITVSQHLNVCIAETHDAAYADMTRFLGERGLDLTTMDQATADQILAMVVWGDADEVGERLTATLERGVDGITCSLPAQGHDPDAVELLGRIGTKVVGLSR